MRTLRSQLILSHILPFVLIFPLVGLVILYLIEAQVVLNNLASNLEDRALMIAQAVEDNPEVLQDPQTAAQYVEQLALMFDGQVYLLDAEGRLLAASPGLGATPSALDVVPQVREGGEVEVSVSQSGLTDREGEAVAPVLDVNQELVGIVGVRQQLQGIASAFTPLRQLVLLIILGGIVLGALFGLWLARRLERPIAAAAEAVHDIAAGRRSEPVPVTGPAELRDLSASVNILSDRLRVLEQTRQRSLANIVHELGRPLGSVHTAVHVLRQGAGDDPAIRAELLDGIERELGQMEPLLDDMALLHSEVTGRQRLERQAVAMGEWLPPAVLPWRAAALEKGLAWSADIPPDLPTVSIDPNRLGQVLGNLLGNAIKYTPTGGSVGFAAAAEGQSLTLRVTDSGPGIEPDEHERVFEPFYRGRGAKRFSEGLGIGLSIARGLVEAHGGTLTLDSTPGRGSTFTVTLPLVVGVAP